MEKEIKVKDLQHNVKYEFSGNIKNGLNTDGTPRISKEKVCRIIKFVKDNEIHLECGRVFLIDNNLHIKEI